MSLHEVVCKFLTKPLQGPLFSPHWLQACLHPAGLVSVSLSSSPCWAWSVLTPGDGLSSFLAWLPSAISPGPHWRLGME